MIEPWNFLGVLARTGADQIIIAWVGVFCRVGGCLLIAPGFSAPQISVAPRLWLAVGLSVAITPICISEKAIAGLDQSLLVAAPIIAVELAMGVLMGTLARLFMSGLETLMSSVATMVGLANPFGVEVDHNLTMSPIASLVVAAATVLMFTMDLHVQLMQGLIESYSVVSFGSHFDTAIGLSRAADVTREAFLVALRICSPFIVYAMIVNVAISLVNKLSPQIAIYVIAMPFSIAGGLFLLLFALRPMLFSFMTELARVLKLG